MIKNIAHNEVSNCKTIQNAITSLGFYPTAFNTITLRLLMLVDITTAVKLDADKYLISLPSQTYIESFGATNGNNSGAYLSLKKVVSDISQQNHFDSICYRTNGRITIIDLFVSKKRLDELKAFQCISKYSQPDCLHSIRSNHALRFYLFCKFSHINLQKNRDLVQVVLTPQQIKAFLGISENEYKLPGNFWSLVKKTLMHLNNQTNIAFNEIAYVGTAEQRLLKISFGFEV